MGSRYHYDYLPTVVRVTAWDIRRGVERNCLRCPVALAARRELKALLTSVTGTGLFVDYGQVVHGMRSFKVELPAEVQERILRFDGWRLMDPFEFTISVPRLTIRDTAGRKEAARA